jgi:hypothetical protein
VRLSARLPDTVRNPLSLLGMAVATAMAVVFLGLAALQLGGFFPNPYIGLLIFVALPLLFLAGLALIPLGAWLTARRRVRQPEAPDWPVIDLRQPRQRTIVLAVIVLTAINVVIVAFATYGGVHAMESNAFCGQVCHVTMEPQATAHAVWPHAQVSCTSCHVGPGAGSFVEAKMAGTRQLFHVMTNRVPRPVPPPGELIQPARATCEGCHWPEKFRGDIVKVVRDYLADEANTESTTTLRLHVGGGSRRLGSGTGIHWHMNLDNQIDFIATGDREQTIPYVKVTNRQGQVREYFAEGTAPESVAGKPTRRMDCMDCHNRPAHTFYFTPERAVNAALAEGRIPRQLSFVRREAVNAVRESYSDRETALAEIQRRLTAFYAERGNADQALVRRAVAATQDVWSTNVFPAMKVTWGSYPSHIGHVDSPGCSRCHDDSHTAADGTVISQDCELCHTLPE